MITNAILNIIYFLLNLLLTPIKLLSNVTVNSNFVSSIGNVSSYLNNLNNFFPITTLITVMFLIFGIELSILTYKFIMWAIKRLPTQS